MFRTCFGTLLNCTAVLRTVRLIPFLNYATLNKKATKESISNNSSVQLEHEGSM